MRSRFTAYVSHNVDYLIATWHPDCGAEAWRNAIVDSFKKYRMVRPDDRGRESRS
ncbi:Hypothetical protein SMB2099_2619 [Serratia marcescens SMB2099]|nr:Hypothetical protein SMB2099_2619 [Serratia marcescens SMB2099]